MAGHYAVTITASKIEVAPEVLAGRLADLLDRSVGDVEKAMRDQTVLLERQLTYREATEIQRQLSRRQIPSQVQSHDQLSGEELLLERADSQKGSKQGDEIECDDDSSNSPDIAEKSDDSDLAQVGDRKEPEPVEQPPGAGSQSGAWAELFPDLEDEWTEEENGANSTSSGGAPGPDVDETRASDRNTGQSASMSPPGETDGESGGWEAVGTIEANGSTDEVSETDDSSNLSAPFDKSPKVGGVGEDQSGDENDDFDAGKIRRAFAAGEDERPPYKPDGYDHRPQHVPLIAALLSVIAPGAGQVYNGRLEEARRWGSTFFLLYPWYKSIREAWSYGEEVRTYYEPRPDEGSGLEALGYSAKWWLVVVTLSMVTAWTVSTVQDYLDEQDQRRAQMTFQQLRYSGNQTVERAVSRATIEAENTEIEVAEVPDGEYTMDDDERARRLFILGYHYCKGGEYHLCGEMMGRVASLKPNMSDVFRIQTWANLRAQGVGEGREMPDVDGEVPTLADFEVRLAAEGRELEDIDDEFGAWWESEGREAVEDRDAEAQAAEEFDDLPEPGDSLPDDSEVDDP